MTLAVDLYEVSQLPGSPCLQKHPLTFQDEDGHEPGAEKKDFSSELQLKE